MKNLLLTAGFIFSFCLPICSQNHPLRNIDKPNSELPKNYGTFDAQGVVHLKAESPANGESGNIIAVTGMPAANLTELVEGATRKIRFEPEINDGNKIVSTRIIECLYSPIGFWESPIILAPLQEKNPRRDDQAEAIIAKVVAVLGGEKYLKVTSQIGKGKFSVVREGVVVSFQSFTDIIVFPDKERTDFKGSGSRSVQTNVGDKGWIYDGDKESVTEQSEEQVANFKRGMRASLDTLLRGHWRGEATLTYVGKRPATLGKRNDVVKLTYTDGLVVEFEIGADDSIPVKAIQRRKNVNGEATEEGKEPAEIVEEDRYAQFVDIDGIKSPFIIDRFTGGVQTSRINYQSVEYNKRIPDSIFVKPANAKEAKKDPKL